MLQSLFLNVWAVYHTMAAFAIGEDSAKIRSSLAAILPALGLPPMDTAAICARFGIFADTAPTNSDEVAAIMSKLSAYGLVDCTTEAVLSVMLLETRSLDTVDPTVEDDEIGVVFRCAATAPLFALIQPVFQNADGSFVKVQPPEVALLKKDGPPLYIPSESVLDDDTVARWLEGSLTGPIYQGMKVVRSVDAGTTSSGTVPLDVQPVPDALAPH